MLMQFPHALLYFLLALIQQMEQNETLQEPVRLAYGAQW